MININGKEWELLNPADIQSVLQNEAFKESFFFELKSDNTTPEKLVKEISAFANSYGGYIFLGVSDDKQVENCTNWNEQRIHSTIYDSISPTPIFDINSFIINGKRIFVIKIEEGPEPPYITNKGLIYERVSSGSFPIKDSSKLHFLYNKNETNMRRWEEMVSIPQTKADLDSLSGYLDIGFVLFSSKKKEITKHMITRDLKEIITEGFQIPKGANLTRIGKSIVFSLGGLSTNRGRLPAHINNFIEIMDDGSARMRVVLTITNEQKDKTQVMNYTAGVISDFQFLYSLLLKPFLPSTFLCAKKYEKLTVLNQFNPTLVLDDSIIEIDQSLKEENEKKRELMIKMQQDFGITRVITDDRIPKNGLYTIDEKSVEERRGKFDAESIIIELFSSYYYDLG